MTATDIRRYLRDNPDPGDQVESMRRRRRLLLIAAGVLVLAVFLTWLVAFSSVFGVRSVVVHGTHQITAAEVTAAAKVPRGTPLVRLDTAAVTDRVEKLPDVASAEVSTSFPSTVTIQITERTPVGYVVTATGVTLVDRTGKQYRTAKTAPVGLPQLDLGAGSAAAADSIATVAGALPPTLRPYVVSIGGLDADSVTLVLHGGKNGKDTVVVRWGSPDHNAEKALGVAALRTRGGSQIDVTDPDHPFTRK